MGSIPILDCRLVLMMETVGDVHEEMGCTVRGDTPKLVGDYILALSYDVDKDSRCSVKTLTPALERL